MQEYLVWLTQEHALRWYVWQEGKYQLQAPDEQGILRSAVFPGLQLAVDSLLAGDMQRVLAVPQAGILSEAHRAFVQTLASRET